MPGLRLKEVRLPELDLPEMSRDDIVRAISDTRRDVGLSRLDPRRLELPGVDLPKVDLPKIDLSKVDLPKVELTRIDLSKVDLPKAALAAAQAVGLVRKRRSRLPFVVGGLITAAIVGIALVNSPLVKPRLMRAAQRWRERMARGEDGGEALAEPVAVPVTPTTYDIAPTTTGDVDPGTTTMSEATPSAPEPVAPLATAEQPEGATI